MRLPLVHPALALALALAWWATGQPASSAELQIEPARPNPSAGEAVIMFALPKTEHVLAAVHDLAGRCVRTLADARFAPGSHRMTWDGRDADGRVVAAGVYFVRLEVAGVAQSRRIVRLP